MSRHVVQAIDAKTGTLTLPDGVVDMRGMNAPEPELRSGSGKARFVLALPA
jgi:hypothetical protein